MNTVYFDSETWPDDDYFPAEPFVLVPPGETDLSDGGRSYRMHREFEDGPACEALCVLSFETREDAETVEEACRAALRESSEIIRLDPRDLDERTWLKFHPAGKPPFLIRIEDYMKRREIRRSY